MSGKFAVLFILAAVNLGDALSLKKVMEVQLPSFCIFGLCISDKKEYDQSIKTHDRRDQTIEELTKKQEELDQWKKEEEERRQLEEDEKRAKMQEEKDSVIAQSCQCTWACGDRNDGTVCFRKCCNNEFGGNPNGPVNPYTPINAAAAPLMPAPVPAQAAPQAAPAVNPFAALPAIPNPFAAMPAMANPFAAKPMTPAGAVAPAAR